MASLPFEMSTRSKRSTSASNLEVVRFLVEGGADVNFVGKYGWTSLMRAAESGELNVVQFPLDNGTDADTTNNDGHTAIFFPCSCGYTDIQNLLMQFIPHTQKASVVSPFRMSAIWFVAPFEVKLQQFIGSGNVGRNYRAKWLDADVVLKLFVPDASASSFAHEVTAWHQLRHPNVIKLYGLCDIGHHFFVCEWASNGSLVEYLAACEKRGERCASWKFLRGAALGIAYLHERKIVHGNLCGSSILIGSDGLTKLADFGLSGWTNSESSGGTPGVSFGAIRWKSPERLNGEEASFTSEIYSLCLCAVEAVTGEAPCVQSNDNDCNRHKKERNPATGLFHCHDPVHLTADLRGLAIKMCGQDPRTHVPAWLFERQTEEEADKEKRAQPEPEPVVNVNEYKNGDFVVPMAEFARDGIASWCRRTPA